MFHFNFLLLCRIFDSVNNESCEMKVPSTSELKTKPDGWETTSKAQDGNIWDISQREEDILLQEFERRIAFSKYQVCIIISGIGIYQAFLYAHANEKGVSHFPVWKA